MEEAKRLPFEDGAKIVQELIFAGYPKDAMIFLLGITTGLRVGDLLEITWEDLRKPQFKVNEQKTKKTLVIDVVPMLQSAALRTIGTYSDGSLRSGVVLVNKQGEAMSRINVHKRIVKWTKFYLHDGNNYSAHSLRKGFGYHFYKNQKYPQVALQKLSERFNHSNQAITLRYLGLNQEETTKVIFENFDISLTMD